MRKFGASGLMAIPTEGDIAGRAADEIGTTSNPPRSQGRADPPVPSRLGRLDVGIRGRQNLYEHYFFGDPVRMAGALLKATDREPEKAHVRAFLERVADESASGSKTFG